MLERALALGDAHAPVVGAVEDHDGGRLARAFEVAALVVAVAVAKGTAARVRRDRTKRRSTATAAELIHEVSAVAPARPEDTRLVDAKLRLDLGAERIEEGDV